MDERDQGQRWLMGQRISTSPSRYQSRQAAPPTAGGSNDRSSIQGTIGAQQMRAPYPSDSNVWQTLPDAQYGQQSGTSSNRTSTTKRRRRSSSYDQGDSRQGYGGEARGRDHDRPPARRQRVESEWENDWTARESGALPAGGTITKQISRSLSPQPYRPSQGGPSRLGGQIDDAPSGRRSPSPSDRIIYRRREDRRYGSESRNRDIPMRSASPPFLQLVDDRASVWRGEEGDERGYPPSRTCDGHGCDYYPVRERPMGGPLNIPRFLESTDREDLPAYGYGATYNIANPGNVLTGPNYGTVYMEAGAARSVDDFMMNLADRLKVCFRAEHMYYAPGEESALRRGQCTPGTRTNVIQGVVHWAIITSPRSECVYWLSGQAGAGKTTIAYTVAYYFENLVVSGNSRVILGGSFFCSRQFTDTRSVSSIIRTVVYQLVHKSPSFRNALKEHGKFETVTHGPRSQLMGLLVTPWEKSAPERLAVNEPCYILPIDALDELEGTGGTEFLGALFDVVDRLSGLKFFVTSRSDPALVQRIQSFPNKRICRLEEVPLKESSADIKVYLDENLAQCATTQQIRQLVSDAAGLFIYAATVVEFVKGRSLEVQRNLLNQVLSTSPSPSHPLSRNATTKLDNLYLQILETSLVDPRDRGDPDVFRDCLSVLHTFLCTIERTSAAVAVAILKESSKQSKILLNIGTAEEILHRLHAVLYVQGDLVMAFHKSFADFLFDARRSQRFFCNQEQHHRHLANRCLRIMAKQLRFNIAGISSSYQMDNNNPTLATCIDANISASLRYACVNWSAHLILAPFELEALDDLAEAVQQFLQLQILFWMELMNLLGQRGHCKDMLRDIQHWFSKSKDTVDLVGKLADAAAFAHYHSTSKAALSTPHLYLSSLATFPRHSAIVQNWRQQFGGIPGFTSAHGVGGEAMVACITLKDQLGGFAISSNGAHVALGLGDHSVRVWDLSTGEEVRVLEGHTSEVLGVAYSPDGTHVASGSKDRSIRVWDLSTGEEVRVLKGHTNEVNAVAYSPNRTHLISGSGDKSVRVWDMSTGHEVRALEGHTSIIMAVACSPDGTQVASGSWDGFVCVWDHFTGEQVMALKGHTEVVRAVAYSPDGTCLISCSGDQTIRVWDMSTGDEAMVLKGHTNEVWAVAYSPDGNHVVSSSNDASIRVWDLSTGKELKIFKGHTGYAEAVAYLPDGTHVVSGSGFDSLRVWDLSAEEERRILKGHIKGVTAVAYSPDGTHVASGSWDKTIQVWDLSTLEEVGVLKGHTDCVRAVAYLPNGTHLVSGSDDKSVRVWDLSTGREVRVFEGHTGWVYAVAYSPDGTHVVSGSADKSIWVWDLSTGKEVRVLKGHTQSVSAVAYSPSGTHVVSGSWDNSVRVWDMSTGDKVRLFKGHTSGVLAVAYSLDGTHVVSGSYASIRLWDLSTGQEVKVLNSHTSWVNALAYSPDGAHLVSGSDDETLHVWNMSARKQVGALKVHAGGIKSVAYSPDGTHVVFCSEDNSVHVWDIFSEHTPCYVHQEDKDGKRTGWLLSPSDPSAHLMFVRPEARVLNGSNVVTLPPSSVSYVDFLNAKFGDKWTECYTPRSL